MAIMTEAGEHRSPFANKFQILVYFFIPGREDAGAKCQKNIMEGRQDLQKQGRAVGGDMQKDGGPSLQRILRWSENYCWSQAVMDRIRGWETKILRRPS